MLFYFDDAAHFFDGSFQLLSLFLRPVSYTHLDVYKRQAYNPPAEVVEKCEVYLDLGDKTDLYNQLWEKVKVN